MFAYMQKIAGTETGHTQNGGCVQWPAVGERFCEMLTKRQVKRCENQVLTFICIVNSCA